MIKWYEPRKNRRKIIEVVQGYASVSDTGHIHTEIKFGQLVWAMPIIYKENPNPDNFRKVQITYEEIRE
uniref:Uncharacterized protein n=1 Tax=viral metagenome TaxID=1070528 RepID=A0A6H1ZWA5_9ZZZZ